MIGTLKLLSLKEQSDSLRLKVHLSKIKGSYGFCPWYSFWLRLCLAHGQPSVIAYRSAYVL